MPGGPDFVVLDDTAGVDEHLSRLSAGHWVIVRDGLGRADVARHDDPVVRHVRAITRARLAGRHPPARARAAVAAWLDDHEHD